MQIELVYAECPHCGKWFQHTTLMSYSAFGHYEYWSDGKCENPDFEYSFIPFIKCDKCGQFFWTDDCNQIPDYEIHAYLKNEKQDIRQRYGIKAFFKANPDFDKNENTPKSINYPPFHYWENMSYFMIKDFMEMLENDKSSEPEREIYLRTKLWHHINDLIRDNSSIFISHIRNTRNILNFKYLSKQISFSRNNKKLYKSYKNIRRSNLLRLSELLQATIEYEETIISMIEIERELGNFSKAESFIKKLSKDVMKHNRRYIKKSKSRIRRKSKKVFMI